MISGKEAAMRELFDITPHSTGPGFRMRLKTGEIDVPDGRGGYIVSSGMGSGKTESIKSLIRHKHVRVFSIVSIPGTSWKRCSAG